MASDVFINPFFVLSGCPANGDGWTWQVALANFPCPNAPCMEYLPTVTLKITQMYVEHVGCELDLLDRACKLLPPSSSHVSVCRARLSLAFHLRDWLCQARLVTLHINVSYIYLNVGYINIDHINVGYSNECING